MEKLLFELSKEGKRGFELPKCDVEEVEPNEVLDKSYLREELKLPQLSQLEVVRHFTRLSQLNYSVDTNFYPLGSCTMKYNPRVNEKIASFEGFLNIHPLQDRETVQGLLEAAYLLKEYLKELGGFADVSLQPAAGAHGELTGLLLIAAYHRDKGNTQKDTVLIPDSAHGTNPASAAIAGFKVLTVKSDKNGELDWNDFIKKLNDRVAALMITNPNTLGILKGR